MKTRPTDAIDVVLQPGDFYFGTSATRIKTLLGSCVSITLWHPQKLIGGMCHYMLPTRSLATEPFSQIPEEELEGKYAEEAFELFARAAQRHRTRLSEYQIKLFGGGHMFPGQKAPGGLNVCKKNIEAAEYFLTANNLKLISKDVGMIGHRVIIFDIWNGNVWVRHQTLGDIKKCQ